MYRIQMLRSLVNERLTAAAEDIFGVFERTLEEYEGEIDRQRKLLDALKPEMRTDSLPPQLLVYEEEVHPDQKEWSPSLFQGLEQTDIRELTLRPVSVNYDNDGEKTQSSQLSQTQDPEPLHVKEELPQGLEEADSSKITVLSVKYEVSQENTLPFQPLQTQREKNREAYALPSTSTEQMKTEPDREDCGASEPDSNLDPAGDLEPTRDGTETDDSDDWKESGESQSGSNTLKSKKTRKRQSLSNSRTLHKSMELSHELKSSSHTLSTPSCKVCGKSFPNKRYFMLHIQVHSSDCGLCGKHLDPTESLKLHIEAHNVSPVSGEGFTKSIDLVTHLRIHNGDKPLSCSVCGKEYSGNRDLKSHMRTHTGENPFSCSVCGKGLSRKAYLQSHMSIHTGEKPFGCSICGKGFREKGALKRHMGTHTGEKPFSCSVCGKGYCENRDLKSHMRTHTGEYPFSCSVCGKGFSRKTYVQTHMMIHAREKPCFSICGKGSL